jgi:aconitate hydratase 2/2-methylisocitrate dehydratase
VPGLLADLVMQSFCHTAAYPKPIDVTTHHTLPDFIMTRGGVSCVRATASSTRG